MARAATWGDQEDRPLPPPPKYLGRMLSYDDSDTPAVWWNLKTARAAWGRLSTIIAKEEVPAPVAGMFY